MSEKEKFLLHSNLIVSVLNWGAAALTNGNEHDFSSLLSAWAIADSMFLRTPKTIWLASDDLSESHISQRIIYELCDLAMLALTSASSSRAVGCVH